MITNILVYAHWEKMPVPELIGILSAHQAKGRKVFSFEYDSKWIKNKKAFLLDPDINFYSGPQFPLNKDNFGVFLDSMPDTWGRTLMKRRAAQIAKMQGNPVPVLRDIDYLLGVADQCRMGALRFKINADGPFLSNESKLPVPPWTSVGELQYVAGLFETDKETKELNKWLGLLLAPGASLGGARPKANIMDKNGHLWIAKFPSINDTFDKAQWEFLAYNLAKSSGITMSESKTEKVTGQHHTFFTKRFDRINGERIHFASAMTMTGNSEDTIREYPASYLDIALFIQNNCTEVQKNLSQLWRRMVFNIAVSNTDDHLRNHGFIIRNESWQLSPAFDINPSVDKEELSLTIDGNSGLLDFELAMVVIEYFRLSTNDAGTILKEVKNAVRRWEQIAKNSGIAKSEIENMRAAFRY